MLKNPGKNCLAVRMEWVKGSLVQAPSEESRQQQYVSSLLPFKLLVQCYISVHGVNFSSDRAGNCTTAHFFGAQGPKFLGAQVSASFSNFGYAIKQLTH